MGFVGYSALAGVQGLRTAGWLRRADVVIAMSPPLTLGLTGRIVATLRRAPLIFNIQDVFPDAAIETGAITNRRIIAVARWLERITYRSADAVTVLSGDLADNVKAKLPATRHDRVHEIPNFVDTDAIVPADRHTEYRTELGLGAAPVVLYGGNVGFSQSLELLIGAARQLPDVQFLVNGDGAARATLEASAADLPNVVFRGYIEPERLSELLATGDIHVVPLRSGAGACVGALEDLLDHGSGSPRAGSDRSGHRGASHPGRLARRPRRAARRPRCVRGRTAHDVGRPRRRERMGANGRRWAVAHASPEAVGRDYDALISTLRGA